MVGIRPYGKILKAIAETDTDKDGMHDDWENEYGLNPLVDDVSDDLDGDGRTNIGEYNRGTDPGTYDERFRGDFNGDGNHDILWRNNHTGKVSVWLTNPGSTGILSSGSPGTVSNLAWKIINTGDFNYGSNTDLLWRNNQTGQVNVWLTNSAGIGVLSKETLGTVADLAWEIQ